MSDLAKTHFEAIPEGPYAFPFFAHKDSTIGCPGMTLRDYFAGQALNQANRDIWEHHKPEHVAKRCYDMADAMIAARGDLS